MDVEHRVSFRFEPRVEGGHVTVTVRSGRAESRALAGELTFRPEEWALFAALVDAPDLVELVPIVAEAERQRPTDVDQ